DLEAVAANLHQVAGSVRLRITTLHSMAYCWLLPRLPRFCALHPNIRISLDTGIALTRFDEAGPDIGIRHGPGQWPGLTAQHLMDDELFPVASPALPGVAAIEAPRDIARLPLVTDLALQGWRDWFRAAGVRGLRLPQMHSFSDSTDAMQAAVYGVGAALARRVVAQPYLQRGELLRLPGPALKARFAYYAVYPSHRPPRPVVQTFIDWLRSQTAETEIPPPPATARL
ncbi:MAG TPA: LysR substrate-binding domain-containing protein, partial [Pseudoxanthomonas sp.]|nr:LysR substrate-binding domain-containing protein [Pseudoxanthomonas sp.]